MEIDVPPLPLGGEAGQLIHSSPCRRFQIWRAILSTFPAEAIVNATNRQMILNTSVIPGNEFQIVRSAGKGLQSYLQTTYGSGSGLPTGESITTPSFDMMNCWYLIHVNGPNYRTRTKKTLPLLKQQLANCYRRCLEEAYKHEINSIAFPCISTGATLGWPRAVAARIGIDTVRRWFGHPVFGPRRRERIRGPIFFLSDPIGPYRHQEDAWLVAFNEFFPASELPPPPKLQSQSPWGPDLGNRQKKNRSVSSRRRENKFTSEPTLKREDAPLGAEGANSSSLAESNPAPKRKRKSQAVSERELQNLDDALGRLEQLPDGPRKRARRPPRRYGHDE